MENKDFLKEHQLEIVVYQDELTQVRSILKEVNEHYVLIYTEEKEHGTFLGKHRYIFRVNCPRTNFATAYFYFGRKMDSVISKRKIFNIMDRNKN